MVRKVQLYCIMQKNYLAASFLQVHELGKQVLDQSVGESYLGDIDLLCVRPAHGIDIDEQRGDDDIGTVFPAVCIAAS